MQMMGQKFSSRRCVLLGNHLRPNRRCDLQRATIAVIVTSVMKMKIESAMRKHVIAMDIRTTHRIVPSTWWRTFIPQRFQLIKVLRLSQCCLFGTDVRLGRQRFPFGNFRNLFHAGRHRKSSFQTLIDLSHHHRRRQMAVFLLPCVRVQRHFFLQQASHLTLWTGRSQI